MNNDFKFVMPAELSKADNGEWVVAGLASTSDTDQQGEIIDQTGMDLSPIDQKRGWFNWDHKPGVENLLGTLDGYRRTDKGLFVKGRLFKNKQKAKDVYDIMSSLGKSDVGRIGMSVEGKILERDKNNPKIIRKCKIDKVALTLNPVNKSTYADLVKSLNVEGDDLIKSIVDSDIEFDSTEEHVQNDEQSQETMFTADQVLNIVQKALGVGAGYTQAPNQLEGGSAMATSNMKSPKKDDEDEETIKVNEKLEKEKPKKKLKKCDKKMYKSNIFFMLDQLQKLHPEHTRSEIWEGIKDRMTTIYPEITEFQEDGN